MKRIFISDEIKTACPELIIASIECSVINSADSSKLWEEINHLTEEIKNNSKLDEINRLPAISATRIAYKTLGKDPNRYRPSAEALRRRIIRELGLYKINTLVDIINYVSLKTGYSIGGFDADKIEGDDITLGVGTADDKFEAIGRGELNIEFLPVYRDFKGGVGTPTSDEERTKIDINTKNILIIINAYSGNEGLNDAVQLMKDMLQKYSFADNFNIWNSNE
ncbi:hypothetical protein LJC30_04530 [Odoribacter sp. OttesenSCG-928-L07]|nr:hypothetical protein [Odoribacter sp. OttesenSCG-928-L07]